MSINQPLKVTALLAAGIAVITLQGCGSSAVEDASIAKLRLEKDSLLAVKNSVAILLSNIDNRIRELDTASNQDLPLVETMKISESHFRHFFETQGVVETDHNAVVNPEVAAKVLSLEVREGETVTKGQVLVILDGKMTESGIAEINTQIELAQTVYDKQKNLWDQKIGSEIQYLEAKNNLESLKKRQATLKAQMDMYYIRAPFGGMVDEVFPKVGEVVSPMQPAIRLVNLEKVFIKADVSEGFLGKIKAGDTAYVVFPSINKEVKTTISRLGNFINPNNRTFRVRFDIANSDQTMKPNLLARIRIMDYSNSKAIVLPLSLVQQNPLGQEFVYTLAGENGDVAKRQFVKTSMSYDGVAEVTEGLKSGDLVITKGSRGIRDGEAVNVREVAENQSEKAK